MAFTIYDLRFTRRLLAVCLLVLGLLCAAPVRTYGQERQVVPASQAEVNAGQIHNKFVAPDTLAGMGAVTNSPTALGYIARQNITSPIAQQAVYGQIQSAKTFGILSNLVALVNLRAEYNPTNQLDLFGNGFSTVNPKWTNGGFICTLTNGLSMGGFGLTNYTLVVTMSRQMFVPTSTSTLDGAQPALVPFSKSLLFSFENTNTGSGQFVDYGEYYTLGVLQKFQGMWPYATNLNNMPVYRMMGLNGIEGIGTVQKNVYCLSCVNGTNYMWINTLPVYTTTPGLSQNLTCSVNSTDLLQSINVGYSTNYNYIAWTGGTHTNGTEVVESMMAFNIGITPNIGTNLLFGSYQMAQWPDWNQPYDIAFGDSLMSAVPANDLAGICESYSNDFLYCYATASPANPNWMNLSQGGSTLAGALSLGTYDLGTFFTGPFPTRMVGLLPQIQMGVPITFWSDLGGNDQQTNAPQNESTCSSELSQIITSYKSLGNVKWNNLEPPPRALTNYIWNSLAGVLQGNSNILSYGLTIKTNPLVDKSFAMSTIFTTNNLAIGHGLGSDGVHAYTNNAGNVALAKWVRGIQVDMSNPYVSGIFAGDGGALTNTTVIVVTNTASPFAAQAAIMKIFFGGPGGTNLYSVGITPGGVLFTNKYSSSGQWP